MEWLETRQFIQAAQHVHCALCFTFPGSHAAPGRSQVCMPKEGGLAVGSQWGMVLVPLVSAQRLSLSQYNFQDHNRSSFASIIYRVSCAMSALLTWRTATMSTQCKVIAKVYVSPLFIYKEHMNSEKGNGLFKQYVVVVIINSRGQAECIYLQA